MARCRRHPECTAELGHKVRCRRDDDSDPDPVRTAREELREINRKWRELTKLRDAAQARFEAALVAAATKAA